ncbi:hypothetical protein T265_01196 [Opisthorchis viverrini]|uniref:Uncharacterized protein n=1 Tax=Opisthorchis viverrini TaxID=6198 RepID=A0A075AAT2_OPIVI|nr:hypothetical protein T265_01196 [Opisthorchis viverrini]KER32920.1 hypothetical protein T265_01196 [Opisthorchis viverrini]
MNKGEMKDKSKKPRILLARLLKTLRQPTTDFALLGAHQPSSIQVASVDSVIYQTSTLNEEHTSSDSWNLHVSFVMHALGTGAGQQQILQVGESADGTDTDQHGAQQRVQGHKQDDFVT